MKSVTSIIGIKEIINIKTKDHSTPNCIEVDDNVITNNTEICNNFNNYFSTVADNILHQNKTPILKSFDKYLTNPTNTSFVFEPCDPLEVYSFINELNPNKGAGPNGIPTKILQLISKYICVPLSKIFNMSVITGVHPDQLKQAHVIPIFK